MIDLNAVYINNKTGNRYAIVRLVINATNAQDGQQMVEYRSMGNEAAFYVREITEFEAKFKSEDEGGPL